MTARRHVLRLRRRGIAKRETREYLDPTDRARLRELLISLVEEETGTKNFDLADGWELVVWTASVSRIIARVRVDKAGRTVVRR